MIGLNISPMYEGQRHIVTRLRRGTFFADAGLWAEHRTVISNQSNKQQPLILYTSLLTNIWIGIILFTCPQSAAWRRRSDKINIPLRPAPVPQSTVRGNVGSLTFRWIEFTSSKKPAKINVLLITLVKRNFA